MKVRYRCTFRLNDLSMFCFTLADMFQSCHLFLKLPGRRVEGLKRMRTQLLLMMKYEGSSKAGM